MASRLAKTFNGKFAEKLSKTLTTKPVLGPTVAVRETIDEKTATPPPPPSPQSTAMIAVSEEKPRYDVQRSKTPNKLFRNYASSTFVPHTELDLAKKNLEVQHLQPAMLPEFFTPNNDINSAIYPQTSMQAKIPSFRQFEVSQTVKNVVLPLKPTRMANPFPDPVKMMESQTVSDSEKREQMWAESKLTTRMLQKRK